MKTILFFALIVITINSFAQKIEYAYSPNGSNRTSRTFNISPFRLANKDSASSAKDFQKIVMQEGISVFPNPAKDKVVLTINDYNPSERNSMSLLDSKGNEILSQKVTQSHSEMNVSQLTPGIYYFKVIKNQQMLYYKLVKID